MILILIPSHFEAEALLNGMAGAQRSQVGGADVTRGKIGEMDVTVGVIGMGLPHAALRARAVIQECGMRNAERGMGGEGRRAKGEGEREGKMEELGGQPETLLRQGYGGQARNSKLETIRGIILAGFAGALEPSLKRGEIFVTAGTEYLLPHLPEGERPRVAKLATVEKIAGTAAGKAELFTRTGAWLCDMEQAHIEAVAREFGLPFIGVRIVSDEAHEDLPAETLSQSYDQATGTYTPWKLAGHVTRNPFRIGPLVGFVRLLPPIRNRMSDCLHTWLRQTGPRLFRT
jgi:nucleoside phosphorylase